MKSVSSTSLIGLALLALVATLAAFVAAPASAQSTWAFCGVVQGPTFYSITSALITSTSASPTTYNGNANSFLGTNSTTGTRRFYNLTWPASASQLQQTANIVSLDGPGSVGGNSNYFFPSSTPKLDGDGLTFAFDSIPLIDGQANDVPGGAGRSLNFWFVSGQYAEETHSGRHETAAISSSLTITQSSTMPTCQPVNTVTFGFCLVMSAQTYSVSFSGTFTTTGIAQRIAANSNNALTRDQQALLVTGATGTRTYTNLSTATTSTTTIVGVLPVNTFLGNTNYLYPAGPLTTDWNGIAFQMSGAVPIAGQTSAGSNVVMWWEPSVSQYIEETAGGLHESTPLYSSFSVYPTVLGASASAPACPVPPPVTTATAYYSFCAQFTSPTWTVVMSGMLTIQNILFSTSAGRTYYLVTAASGSRTFTNVSTGVSTTNYITSLASPGSLGGNNNRLYTTGMIVDGDGLTFVFDTMPPIAGQPMGTSSTNQMNFWFGSSEQRYLEETIGGTHESTPTASSVTTQSANTGAAVPVCTLPSLVQQAGESTWLMCATLVGSSYTSAVSALLAVNSTRQTVGGETGYRALRASGSRTYTSMVSTSTGILTQQTTYITQLDPPGSLGGNDNYIFPLSSPLLNGNGLTFHLNTIPLIAGQDGNSNAASSMNFWWLDTVNSYLEENAGGRHEITPVASIMSLTAYAPAQLGVGAQCNLPATISISFCFVMVGPGFTTRFSGLMSVSALAKTVAANSGNQLTRAQQAFTVVGATGRRDFTNLTTGAVSTSNVVGVAPGFIGATNYVYFDNDPTTDWNGIAFNMDAQVAIAGQPNGGSTFVLWYERSIGQYIEETQSGRHEATPTYSTLTFSQYTGTAATCTVPAVAQKVIYFSFCAKLQADTFTSVISGVLFASNVVLTKSNKNAYLLVGANGTRVHTETSGDQQQQLARISGLASPGSLGGNNNMLFFDSAVLLDGDGLTFQFDREPFIAGQPLGSTPDGQMNFWFGSTEQQYLEETAGGKHETTPRTSSMKIQAWTGGSLPQCTMDNNGGSTDASTSGSSLSGGAIAGIVIGVIAGCLLLLAVLYVVLGRRSKTASYGTQREDRVEMSEVAEEHEHEETA